MYFDQFGNIAKGVTTPVYSANTDSGSGGSITPLESTSGPYVPLPQIISDDTRFIRLNDLSHDTPYGEPLSEEQKKAETEVNAAVYGKILSR